MVPCWVSISCSCHSASTSRHTRIMATGSRVTAVTEILDRNRVPSKNAAGRDLRVWVSSAQSHVQGWLSTLAKRVFQAVKYLPATFAALCGNRYGSGLWPRARSMGRVSPNSARPRLSFASSCANASQSAKSHFKGAHNRACYRSRRDWNDAAHA